jgi:alpha-glucosidase
MLAGPMDYTPGVLSLEGRNQPIHSTIARQLADYVVLYSPVHMAADLPEHYAQHMDAFRFIRDVPVDWQETHAINGEVGDYVTLVRKDRNSEDWYLGSVTDENARTLEVPLAFLTPGKRYVAQIYRDGDDADGLTEKRFSFARDTREVTSTDTLTLTLARAGGAAVRFVAGH